MNIYATFLKQMADDNYEGIPDPLSVMRAASAEIEKLERHLDGLCDGCGGELSEAFCPACLAKAERAVGDMSDEAIPYAMIHAPASEISNIADNMAKDGRLAYETIAERFARARYIWAHAVLREANKK